MNQTLSIQIDDDSREDKYIPTPIEELVEVEIKTPERVVRIGVTLYKQ